MNEGKKLTIQMALFFLITFVLLGTIVVKEKQNILFLPKIENSITTYISDNYKDLELETSQVTEKNNTFTMKVKNKNNKNHYFYIKYSNKKITDTYKEDYLEGKSLLDHLSSKLEKELLETTKNSYKISFDNTFNNYSEKVQQLLLKEDIKSLKIYTVEKELSTTWTKDEITKKITDTMSTLEKSAFTPKNYTITITNKADITQSIKITNLKYSLIKNNNLSIIINDILNNKETNIIKENQITFENLN